VVPALAALSSAWFALLAAGSATSQTTPAASTTDEAVMLSTFEVRTQQDKGYAATSTLSGARLATNLKETPAMVYRTPAGRAAQGAPPGLHSSPERKL
jgi:hypothetical protein